MNNERIIKNKKVLVTGGAGFIGSNLCKRLLEQNNQVVCMDNLATGFMYNIEEFMQNPSFEFIEGDIRDYDDCRKAVNGVDIILHQAALGSVPRSVKNPSLTNAVNSGGFVNMLFAAVEAKVKRFVFASSSSVYGDSEEYPKVEERIGNPLSPYAISKLTNEIYARNFSEIYGIETIGLRYFNVFGPKQDPNGAYAAVIPKWSNLLLNHESPVINGDGKFSRDFTFIENVLQANQLAAIIPSEIIIERQKIYYTQFNGNGNSILKNGSSLYEIFNIACGAATTLFELFNTLRTEYSKQDKVIASVEALIGPKREGDIPHSLANVDKAKEILGYSPDITAVEGLQKACGWYYMNAELMGKRERVV